MRAENIEITAKIQFRSPDCNGYQYDQKSWNEAMLKCAGKPIIKYDGNGDKTVIGVVNTAVTDGFPDVKITGTLFHAGTDEEVLNDGYDIFTTVEIQAIGISE